MSLDKTVSVLRKCLCLCLHLHTKGIVVSEWLSCVLWKINRNKKV